MLTGEIVHEIRLEARLVSTNEEDDLILILLKEYTEDFAQRHHYGELYVAALQLDLTEDGKMLLPEDVMHVDYVQYGAEGDYMRTLTRLDYSVRCKGGSGAYPYAYQVKGRYLYIWPYGDLSGSITISYYKRPVVELEEEFPLPSLWIAIKRAVIARLARKADDFNESAAFQGDAADSFRGRFYKK